MGYTGHMQAEKRTARLPETALGGVIAASAVVLWIVSGPTIDWNSYTTAPYWAGLAVVAALLGAGLLTGFKVVRLTPQAWVSLLAGGYFLGRCCTSYSVTQSWGEAATITGCFVFYLLGCNAAQGSWVRWAGKGLAAALGAAMLCFCLMHYTDLPQAVCGRPEVGLSGAIPRCISLFVYKNHAGTFFFLGGWALIWLAVWARGPRRLAVPAVLTGIAALWFSLNCGTRAVLLLLPVCVTIGWWLWIAVRTSEARKVRGVMLLIAVLLSIAMLVPVVDLLLGGDMYERVLKIDTHGRFDIWKGVLDIISNAPAWGNGVASCEWDIIPFYSEWNLPNAAHNEYLQLWADYGIIGLLLAVGIILAHLIHGFGALTEESAPREQRLSTAVCMLLTVGLAAYAVCDYPWHSTMLACMNAFCCGVLAAPHPRMRMKQGVCTPVPVRAESTAGRTLMLLGLTVLVACSTSMACRLAPTWLANWQYNAMVLRGAPAEEQRRHLAAAMQKFPASAIYDRYLTLPGREKVNLSEAEQLARLAVQDNPHQLYTWTQFAEMLCRQGKFAEAESALRNAYPGDGPAQSCLNHWPAAYGQVLLAWGDYCMQRGEHARALSLFSYAERLGKVYSLIQGCAYRSDLATALPKDYHRKAGALTQYRMQDLQIMRDVGITPDDSWMAPAPPHGKPALYLEAIRAWEASNHRR